jgi:hypothetical protein
LNMNTFDYGWTSDKGYSMPRYSIATALLADNCALAIPKNNNHMENIRFDELDVELGSPLAPAYQVNGNNIDLIPGLGWNLTASSGTASLRMDVGAQCATVTQAATNVWDIKVKSGSAVAYSPGRYTLYFKARAQNRYSELPCKVAGITNGVGKVTTDWREYSVGFDVTTSGTANVEFHVGTVNGSIWFKDIKLCKHGDEVWRRDYSKAIVLVNAEASSKTVNLESQFKKITGVNDPAVNDGSLVNSVQLGARDGIILMRLVDITSTPTTPPNLNLRPLPRRTKDLFRKRRIEYKPQASYVVEQPPILEGEEGLKQVAADVSEVLSMLIDEVKVASTEIEESLSSFAIADGKRSLVTRVQEVLETAKPPTSVSYRMYSELAGRPNASDVRNVFEEKAYSAWGNASIALVEALTLISDEATKAKAYIDDGASDEAMIDSIAKWAGHARGFTVDATLIASAVASDELKDEISVYRSRSVDVQKSAIVGASVAALEVKGHLAKIKQLYSSGNIYDSIIDTDSVVEPMTSGVVASILNLHLGLAEDMKINISDDVDYRTEAFIESSQALIESVSKLRTTQMINSELSGNGVSELEVDDVVTTKPDLTYDRSVLSDIR